MAASGAVCVVLFIKFYLDDNHEEYVMVVTRSTHVNDQKYAQHVARKT